MNITELKNLLEKGGYSCVLSNGSQTLTSYEKGVKPLVSLIDSGVSYKGYLAADKVVGKSAALLYCVLGVAELYAEVIAKDAITVCNAHGIAVAYSTVADKIINRKGDDICPMEKLVANIDEPLQAYTAIKNKISQM